MGERNEQTVFSYVLRHKEALWMGVPASYNLNDLVTAAMRQSLGQGMFFVAPLLAGKRWRILLLGFVNKTACRRAGWRSWPPTCWPNRHLPHWN